ncbi:hypothetical protein [Mucilaginibacter lappiensis]|uniref:Uncharacterized protein n=1 Tax=Mucilaginibacter lappiensis TaxID=354630 RepID=A0A841J7D2_9SPHI|nr:hypothetical protein [Mucilaginibacter lappiensis]MBB6126953.1 hypothetical protein [Mucilaginibacter lappiensis]
MNCSPAIEKINSTFQVVRETSFHEKKESITYEERVNNFLDRILEFKNDLSDRCKKLEGINESLESLTWINDLDDECLMAINDLISSAKELHSVIIRQYITINAIKEKGIAKDVIHRFKMASDDLREIVSDLDVVFFHLPNIPGFQETTKELSLI